MIVVSAAPSRCVASRNGKQANSTILLMFVIGTPRIWCKAPACSRYCVKTYSIETQTTSNLTYLPTRSRSSTRPASASLVLVEQCVELIASQSPMSQKRRGDCFNLVPAQRRGSIDAVRTARRAINALLHSLRLRQKSATGTPERALTGDGGHAMTEPKPESKSDDVSPAPRRRPGATWHGFVPDDQPIYSRSWNFPAGNNLAPKPPTDDEPPKSAA